MGRKRKFATQEERIAALKVYRKAYAQRNKAEIRARYVANYTHGGVMHLKDDDEPSGSQSYAVPWCWTWGFRHEPSQLEYIAGSPKEHFGTIREWQAPSAKFE